MKHIESFT
jgi:hypothetical protein